MRSKTIYICDTCNKEFDSIDEAKTCEASHMGLTLDEYLKYEELKNQAQFYGYRVSLANNDINRDMFDFAIQQLVDFEKKHNLKKGA